ncbi:hypothetical protein PSI23_20805 [Xenorhabdus sp. XENO-10]|uniref:Uncharacterized protein n=1 Tax=Xenorhabdus yunnanensis TaxID=3025878 RepID=A0ABT5LKL5_9GAMM|nr:hypothetical protein [Xenorhabdus yunnanensis]MDC9591652.1 hypothetical protein [Xenorhabdus yunnanensis]
MAGLPGGQGVSGGTWAMGGLSLSVPVQSVQAAQSPLNIMQGDYAPLTGQHPHRMSYRQAVRSAQSALCLAPPLINIAKVPPHKAGALCCQLLSQSLPKTRTRPKYCAPFGSHPFCFSRRTWLKPTTLQAGRPAASAFTSPAPTPLHCLRAARSRFAPCSLPCSPSSPRAAPAGGFPCKHGTVIQSRAQSETPVTQSVAGRRLQALCRPHPQNGRPPPKQVGQRSAVTDGEKS